jgi:hypothetical protein
MNMNIMLYVTLELVFQLCLCNIFLYDLIKNMDPCSFKLPLADCTTKKALGRICYSCHLCHMDFFPMNFIYLDML